jgi:hypothetical protein
MEQSDSSANAVVVMALGTEKPGTMELPASHTQRHANAFLRHQVTAGNLHKDGLQ